MAFRGCQKNLSSHSTNKIKYYSLTKDLCFEQRLIPAPRGWSQIFKIFSGRYLKSYLKSKREKEAPASGASDDNLIYNIMFYHVVYPPFSPYAGSGVLYAGSGVHERTALYITTYSRFAQSVGCGKACSARPRPALLFDCLMRILCLHKAGPCPSYTGARPSNHDWLWEVCTCADLYPREKHG